MWPSGVTLGGMRDRVQRILVAAAFFGAVAGVVLTQGWPSFAARNASGTYALPSGQPVVAGTTITASTFNTLTSDIASELTDSLSRSGKGAMTAPLELANGTVSLPAVSFDSDPDTGLYRIAANNIGIAVNGVKVADIGTVAATLAVTGVTGQTNVQSALTAAGTSNGIGATLTGAGTGSGAAINGGANQTNVNSALVVTANASGNGRGATITGAGTGAGLVASGSGTAVGATFANGTAAVAGTARNAATLVSGNLNFSPAVNPTSTVAFSNTLTPSNFIKAWATISLSNATPFVPTVLAGFNIASVARTDASTFTLTLASAMADTNFAPTGQSASPSGWVSCAAASTTTVTVTMQANAGVVTLDGAGVVRVFHIFVMGAQ